MNKEKKQDVIINEEELAANEACKPDEDAGINGYGEITAQEELAKAFTKMAENIKKLEETNADYLKALQRERADFENYRKRNQSAVADAMQAGMADTITAILPVLDNFERALHAVPPEEQERPIVKGIQMVYKQILDILAGMGLLEIPAEGESFDPNLHHAVMQESAGEGEEEGDVKEVFNKGYMLNGRVLRYSVVKVIGGQEKN